ncbi:beta-glucosidase family protein [Nocardia pseudovaccinii]|uniref:beta-glucosidase family protein n=1 Tax=Nocardia pseudovaccinii TaxID=189540 RepID=UPI003D8B1AF8
MDPLQRADDLLARMTLEEKAFQLTSVMPMDLLGPDGAEPDRLAARIGSGIGHISALPGFGVKPSAEVARCVNQIQRFLVEKTRLGIPAIFHNEALNGVMAPGFTVFPTAIGLAATWDPDAVQRMATVVGRQLRAIGMRQALSPVLDVARDARWGRVHETYGEDPYLAAAMGVAYVRGVQSQDVIATGKHFLGYAMTEGGQNMAATSVTPRELYEVYARPFAAAIHRGDLGSVMNSYSEYDGVPIGASPALLTELLRDRLGFTGTVVSDYMTVDWLVSRHQVAADHQQAAALALAAGLDVELPEIAGYGPALVAAVRGGAVAEELVDRSVRRVLRDKFALGLFDQPYIDEDPITIRRTATEGAELATELARKSVTLLTNDSAILPLRHDIRRIAVIGPHAEDVTAAFPTYTYPAMRRMIIGRARSATAMPGTESLGGNQMSQAAAAQFAAALAQDNDDWVRAEYPVSSLADALRAALPDCAITAVTATSVTGDGPADIPAAVAAAQAADLVVLALGGRAGWFPDDITDGEGHDTADIELPAAQLRLVQQVAATGTPTIGVIQTGRPLVISSIVDDLHALVWTYYGGQAGAQAVAEVLTGAADPGGKLPYSIPRHAGQVPVHHAQRVGSGYRRTASDMHTGYLDMPATPLFAFGHGIGYTTFAYGELDIDPPTVPIDSAVTVSVPVTNTGDRAGDEVVQLYIHDTATGLTRPGQELAGFARVHVAPGATTLIEFTIQLSQLAYVGLDGDLVLEPGPVDVQVGAASDDIRRRARFEIVGEPITLSADRAYLSDVRTHSTAVH